MEVTKTRTVTIVLTEIEASEYWIEVYEMEALLAAGPGQGNTRTGLARIRQIRDQIAALGLGFTPVPYTAAGPAMTGQVVGAAQGTLPPQPPYPQQPQSPPQPPWVAR